MIETVLEYLLIYWALPSLVTMLLLILVERDYKAHPLELCDYNLEDWRILAVLSILYPIGLWFVLMEWIGSE